MTAPGLLASLAQHPALVAMHDAELDKNHTRELGMSRPQVNDWLAEAGRDPVFANAPDSRQHFDVWNLPTGSDGSPSHFGRMPECVKRETG